MLLRFLTSTPLDVRRGSGTFVGIAVLARTLEDLGHTVRIESSDRRLPVHTLGRYLFNRHLKPSDDADLTIGFDMDGYTLAGRGARHVAALKGVISDELRFERGLVRATMQWQACREREHALRASLVIATSRYSAARARECYGLAKTPAIVPELIDLREWSRLLQLNPAPPHPGRFTVLAVGRQYRRKRVEVLLRAAARLAGRIPGLEVRIVGDGPRAASLRALGRRLKLENTVRWLGNVGRAALAAEYNRAQVFCHPSVQEGFGIVFLEAMAAAVPIVAARAAATPEVVPDGLLVEPESDEALAAGLESLYRDPDLRAATAARSARRVELFDAPRVASLFLETVAALWNRPPCLSTRERQRAAFAARKQ